MKRLFKNRMFVSVSLSVVLTFAFVFAVAYSATTISTDITTAGNLTVTGTAGITGVTTMVNASTTNISTTGNIWANGFATTTGSSGNFATEGTLTVTGATWATSTLQVTGATTLYSTLRVTGVTTMVNASTTKALTVAGMTYLDGGLTMNTDKLTVSTIGLLTTVFASTTAFTNSGVASTSQLVVGGNGTSISGLVFGYCNIGNITITASSTGGVTCASATGVRVDDRVFVQATSSLPTNFVILSASSTATAGQIGLYIYNLGYPAGVTGTGGNSINFWAVR